MSEKRFEKGFTKIGHIHCIFEDGKETNMLFHDNDDDINPYCKDGKSDLDRVVDKLNELSDENEQLRLELDTHKHPLWSTREAERKVNKLADSLADEVKKNGVLNEELNQLRIENMRLKKKDGDGV